jgi:hypothetical protein
MFTTVVLEVQYIERLPTSSRKINRRETNKSRSQWSRWRLEPIYAAQSVIWVSISVRDRAFFHVPKRIGYSIASKDSRIATKTSSTMERK